MISQKRIVWKMWILRTSTPSYVQKTNANNISKPNFNVHLNNYQTTENVIALKGTSKAFAAINFTGKNLLGTKELLTRVQYIKKAAAKLLKKSSAILADIKAGKVLKNVKNEDKRTIRVLNKNNELCYKIYHDGNKVVQRIYIPDLSSQKLKYIAFSFNDDGQLTLYHKYNQPFDFWYNGVNGELNTIEPYYNLEAFKRVPHLTTITQIKNGQLLLWPEYKLEICG